MSKHLFIINDSGDTYTITGTRMEMDDSFTVDPELYFETAQEDFYYMVRDLVNGDNDVKFLKSVARGALTFEGLMVTPIDSLKLHKARVMAKGKHLLKQRCDFIVQFDFFEFSVLNNKFVDAGYIITDANREAKYLEIINTGNEDLINQLDAYLECKDRISVSVHNYNNFVTFRDSIDVSTNTLEVDAVFTAFAALYN